MKRQLLGKQEEAYRRLRVVSWCLVRRRGVWYPIVLPGMFFPNPTRCRILRVTDGGLEGAETAIRSGPFKVPPIHRHQPTSLDYAYLFSAIATTQALAQVTRYVLYAMLSLLPMCLGKNLRWRATRLLVSLHTRAPGGSATASRCCGTDSMEVSSHTPTLWRSTMESWGWPIGAKMMYDKLEGYCRVGA